MSIKLSMYLSIVVGSKKRGRSPSFYLVTNAIGLSICGFIGISEKFNSVSLVFSDFELGLCVAMQGVAQRTERKCDSSVINICNKKFGIALKNLRILILANSLKIGTEVVFFKIPVNTKFFSL